MKAIRIVVTNVTIPNTTDNIAQSATIVGWSIYSPPYEAFRTPIRKAFFYVSIISNPI